MDILEATRSYDRWLGQRTWVVERDLDKKHAAMAEAPFTLLRAAFYRFMQLWNAVDAELRKAPRVLAVGDLHVENFGTWRDAEGRLIWGINDFDEAYPLPFTLDLVRLATSAHLAIAEEHLSVRSKEACDAILEGYVEGLSSRGAPFVLAERNTWLWRLAMSESRDPKKFWHEQEAKCAAPPRKPPKHLTRLVTRALPKGTTDLEILHRSSGKGSLGRQRFLFRGTWNGGIAAREAKPLVPSACVWAAGKTARNTFCGEILKRAVRDPDPLLVLKGPWLIRRLAPDCSKIDLAHLPSGRDEAKLLWAMGFETANIHLGTAHSRKAILGYLRAPPKNWLHQASKLMVDAANRDFELWRRQR